MAKLQTQPPKTALCPGCGQNLRENRSKKVYARIVAQGLELLRLR